MNHKLELILSQASYAKLEILEWITFNALSVIFIVLDIYDNLPDWVVVLVGLSIVFFNIARGIKALRTKKSNNQPE